MPEYLAPGVYVEEVSYRSKLIEGVSTSTAGFVGPARYGPTDGMPVLITSVAEFERAFGTRDQLLYGGESDPSHNYLAHAVQAFFENGGRRVYVARIFQAKPNDATRGRAYADVTSTNYPGTIHLRARFPGQAGRLRLSFTFRLGKNVLQGDLDDPTVGSLKGVTVSDVVYVTSATSPPADGLYYAERVFDDAKRRPSWILHAGAQALDLRNGALNPAGDSVQILSLTVEAVSLNNDGIVVHRDSWDGVGLHPDHRRSLAKLFAEELGSFSQEIGTPFTLEAGTLQGPEIGMLLLDQVTLPSSFPSQLSQSIAEADQGVFQITLANGDDGVRPEPGDYAGSDADPDHKTGLKALEDVPDISIVAAPGYSDSVGNYSATKTNIRAVMNSLITHCENMRYRIAVLDSVPGQGVPEVRDYRAQVDSTYGALYYPWVHILDPITDAEIDVPPSGFLAGIYARNDIEKGVHKAPANEVVRGALRFELPINKGHQDVLNPEGINVLRYFEGRGYRVWGARTISSDPEWKYVNLRRYFAFLERSIDRGTQWAVFEPNGEALWGNVRRTIEDFLFNEWKSGHLLGSKPEEAYFVKCDRTTMTQNDLDNGRMVCLIGVAPLRPAEFVIFRIGQWTADRKA
jgi:Bacteriophage tail sheath protein